MISEGSCDTENWSNYAEKSALITATFYSILQKKAVFHNITVLQFFIKINSDLLSRTDSFKTDPNILNNSVRLWF